MCLIFRPHIPFQNSREKGGSICPEVKASIITNQLEATQGKRMSNAVTEVETIEHFLNCRVSFVHEEIKSSCLYWQVSAKSLTSNIAFYRCIMLWVANKTVDSNHLDGQMNHQVRSILAPLPQTTIVIRFAERDMSLHFLSEGERGEIGRVSFTGIAQLY